MEFIFTIFCSILLFQSHCLFASLHSDAKLRLDSVFNKCQFLGSKENLYHIIRTKNFESLNNFFFLSPGFSNAFPTVFHYFRFIYNINIVSGYCGNSAGKYPGGKFEVSWVALLAYCNRLTLNLFVNLLTKIDDSLKKIQVYVSFYKLCVGLV